MQPNPAFVNLPQNFWANVRTISQAVGYTVRRRRQAGIPSQPGPIKIPTLAEMKHGLEAIKLDSQHVLNAHSKPTKLGKQLLDYFEFRASCLNDSVEPLLMDAKQAELLFNELKRRRTKNAPFPMNKQSGKMKRPAYFTAIVNMLIEETIAGLPCNYNPQELTTVTRNKQPFRTLSRRVDGAFPGPVDPLAVWEIKEYYYTTTFGSRVADGVYETLLDGMELEELDKGLRQLDSQQIESRLRKISKITHRPPRIQHLLMLDAHFTWWIKGRSYLCRVMDMLHMGYVDEVLFGREVVARLPELAKEWVSAYKLRK